MSFVMLIYRTASNPLEEGWYHPAEADYTFAR
jgi:hypothetical protein